MFAAVAHSWKLLVTLALIGIILLSLFVRPPSRTVSPRDLRQLVIIGAILYLIGGFASLSHRSELAAGVYATGILICSLAVWLSRGMHRDDGSEGEDGGGGPSDDHQPPPDPDGVPPIDWDEFERELAEYSERVRH